MSISRTLQLAFALAAVTTVSAASARAMNCVEYGERAVHQQEENLKLGCGFNGAPWSTDMRGHANWCRGADGRNVASEDAKRVEQLNSCKAMRRDTAPRGDGPPRGGEHRLRAAEVSVVECQGTRFRQSENGQWTEHRENQDRLRWNETRRDEWSVYLRREGGEFVQLDLRERSCKWGRGREISGSAPIVDAHR